MVKPYYQDDNCTIYHGDCREILPQLEPVDLVLTDPPYGIKDKIIRGGEANKKNKFHKNIEKWDILPDRKTFELITSISKNQILWGGNYFVEFVNHSRGWLVWDKKIPFAMSFAMCELAYTSYNMNAKIFEFPTNRLNYEKFDGHPTPKPLQLFVWCISLCPDKPQPILDPFMGSGTTLRAAKDLNRKAIGIEIEEKYCEIAVERLRQEVLAL